MKHLISHKESLNLLDVTARTNSVLICTKPKNCRNGAISVNTATMKKLFRMNVFNKYVYGDIGVPMISGVSAGESRVSATGFGLVRERATGFRLLIGITLL